ncbi:MAG: anthranilate synthase component I family protein [Pseudomonadota bacterium]
MTVKKTVEVISIQQQARFLTADMDTPISLFMKAAGAKDGILLESAEVDGRWGRFSVLACHTAIYIHCVNNTLALRIDDERLKGLAALEGMPFIEGLRAVMAALDIQAPSNVPHYENGMPAITRGIYGYMDFGMAALFSQKLQATMSTEEAGCAFILPHTVLVFDHLYNRLCQVSLGEHKDLNGAHDSENTVMQGRLTCDTQSTPIVNMDNVTAVPDAEGYMHNVERIKAMLQQGEAIQVVPSVNFSTDYDGDAFDLYRRLRRFNPSPYMFYMHLPALTLFGSSPEVMVRCTADRLQLSPIAGTRKRGATDLEDRELAEELLADPKERAEHVMLVDLGRNDLGRVAKPDSVNLERFMEIERFSHVMHITSHITAQLESGLDALDVLASTFPAGTVSGAPKIRAMEIIRELEDRPRGPYAGCIGWIGLDKDHVHMDMGITIRSMWHQDGKLNWQAGAGIVHDSDPQLEWNEVCQKSAIMRLALVAS